MLALTTVQVEPVGRWYESFCSRRHHQQTLSHGSIVSSSSDDEEAELELDEEDDSQLLASLDPKEWKVIERFCLFLEFYFILFAVCLLIFKRVPYYNVLIFWPILIQWIQLLVLLLHQTVFGDLYLTDLIQYVMSVCLLVSAFAFYVSAEAGSLCSIRLV